MKTKVFSAVFAIATLLVLVWSCSTSEPAPTPPPATTAVDVSATDIATTGFTLSFSVAVPELAATDIKLDGDATVTSIAVSGAENKVYTVVTSALTEGKVYNVSIGKANYTFNPAPLALTIPKSTDTKVNVTFSNMTTTGFTLNLSAVVTGLVATDITLSNSATISSITGADTKTVNVVCSALAAGTTYTVTIAKAGFSFTPQPMTFIVPSAPVAGVQITDFRIVSPTIATLKRGVIPVSTGANTMPNAPRWLQADKATVKAYFTLPTGATAAVGTTALASGDKLDLSSGTATIKVTNGTDTAEYTITLAAYDATTNPYGIYTPGDLSDMRNGMAVTDSYKLMNDITLPNMAGYDNAADTAGMGIADYATAGWRPIWDGTNHFLAFVDGNNKVVSNLKINRSTTDNVGLFGALGTGSVVKKLGVTTAAEGNVSGNNNVGILSGYSTGTISYCYTKGSVIGSLKGVGGIAGYNEGSISNTYSTSSVGGPQFRHGGIVGNGKSGAIINCYSTGYISGDDSIGGIVGYCEMSINTCYSISKVQTSPTNKGGLVGLFNGGNDNIQNSYWDVETSLQPTSPWGGTGQTTAQMKAGIPYNDKWTSDNWIFTAGQYPKLVGVGGQ